MSKNNISHLISGYLLGELNENQKKLLEDWVNKSEENRKFFDEICSSKKVSATYFTYKKIDYGKAYQNFLIQTGQQQKRTSITPGLKYAAVALLLIALSLPVVYYSLSDRLNPSETIMPGNSQAVLITDDGTEMVLKSDSAIQIKSGSKLIATNDDGSIHYNKSTDKKATERYNTLIVPRGGEYRVTLADGTKIHLNSASELRYPIDFESNKREVYLKGEAYFEIAKDSTRPFYVIVDDIKVKQYGTQFNVSTRKEDQVNIVLVEGSVSVLTNNSANEYMLEPSQLASYSTDDQSVDIKKVDVAPYVAWNNGRFIFEDEKLSDIMETLSLWYDVDAEFKNPGLEQIRFTGNVSREAPINTILSAIEFSNEVKITVREKNIIINN